MSSREPTLADVAQLAGVSPTTVSRVLNNRGYLSEKTKRSVAAPSPPWLPPQLTGARPPR